ncbi:unnamed protein product [Thelazia callipaeda]|uniref:G domain-containing protein n=1 Tax=Thelazia callipaeda TaxID=103827 RepID=A0A158RC69_THECL|nr:unnamed protein product [Thelazia callipaeda]
MSTCDEILEDRSDFNSSYASPSPSPARGIYGASSIIALSFALFICSWFTLTLYLIWAFIPTPYLESIYWTYVPANWYMLFKSIIIYEYIGMLGKFFETVELFSFSLVLIRYRTQPFSQRLRRKSHISPKIPSHTPSVAQISDLIQTRLEIRLKQNQESTPVTVDSLSASRYLKINADKYATIVAQQEVMKSNDEQRNLGSIPGRESGQQEKDDLPLAGSFLLKADFNISNSAVEDSLPLSKPGFDRGFYVCGDKIVDEFVVGSTFDIPGGELENVDCAEVVRYGSEDAVEEIDFQLPMQSTDPKCNDVDDEIFDDYGSVDSSVPISNKRCCSCGANFHCQDASLPGFLPAEIFLKLNDYKDQICRRCYMLKKHNFLLNVNVCEVDYRSMMEHLKLKQEALIIFVVDMTDFPGSIYSELPQIIGYQKPMIVVGNKVDLLPPDARPGFLRHYRQVLFAELQKAGFSRNFNILNISLISAKTGYGVESLVTNIFLKFSTRETLRNDMYLVGCTNAGKSTLFNALLQSDLCKVRAVDLVERAAVTPWPGTTVSLLKFPVMNPTPHKLEIRRRRLLSNQAWQKKEACMRHNLYMQTGDIKYATLQATIENSFKDRERELQPPSLHSVFVGSEETSKSKRVFDPHSMIFAKGKWCYDTPGTVSSDQILNLFTLDELVLLLPRKMVLPRTFILHPEESILLGGVAQIDVVSLPVISQSLSGKDHPERRSGALLTVFASERLPIFVKKTPECSSFRKKYLGSQLLVIPSGSAERIARFPDLKGSELLLKSSGSWKGCGDVVLSSLGWVCVTARRGEVRLQAHTPEGRGLFLRQPALLPFCAELRGSRIGGTAAYKVKRPTLPNMEKKSSKKKVWSLSKVRSKMVNLF